MFSERSLTRAVAACALSIMFAVPTNLWAEAGHLVSPSDLQKEAVASSQLRQQNINKVREFLSSETAVKALKSANINPQQVQDGVSRLSDQELSQLAARADKAQHDFAGGLLTTRDLVLIVLAIAIIILIIVLAT